MHDLGAYDEADGRIRLARILHELDALIVQETNILLEDYWVVVAPTEATPD